MEATTIWNPVALGLRFAGREVARLDSGNAVVHAQHQDGGAPLPREANDSVGVWNHGSIHATGTSLPRKLYAGRRYIALYGQLLVSHLAAFDP